MKEDGRYGRGGGSRLDEREDLCRRVLPKALESLSKYCRLNVVEKSSKELMPVPGNECESRDITKAFRMQSGGLDYLAK